jgi:tetratricopeptide (TPR) repeat protein
MAGPWRWLSVLIIGILLSVSSAYAQDSTAPAPPPATAPASVTEDVLRLLEIGKMLMGHNNPAVSCTKPVELPPEARNAAGERALHAFRSITKLDPKCADGWLWLGIALTQRLRYNEEAPQGEPVVDEAALNEGFIAFRTAYECHPRDPLYVSYYGEMLMSVRKDFEGARRLWDTFYQAATNDMQRVTALVQAARACLNHAYFGKAHKRPAEEVQRSYYESVSYIQKAAKIYPNATDVKEMQRLVQEYRKLLCGK